MATGDGFDKKEFKNQMEQLEKQFAGLGQNKENKGQETGQKSPEKEQIKQNTFETYHDARPYETRETRHRVPDQDDEKDFFIGQVKAITAALSVPLSSVITPFEGDAQKFKQWIKEVEKYSVMSGKQGHEIPMLAYITSKGSVGDYIKRYLDETDASEEIPSWNDLKESLKNRFAEITDPQHALAVMRKTRQNSNESVQLFAERLLQIAEDAYSNDRLKDPLIQQQLVDIFCDGLTFDYLRMKILRENPKDLESAIQIAMREQNLRQRLAIRGSNMTEIVQSNDNRRTLSNFDTTLPLLKDRADNLTSVETRHVEPMEIDHARNSRCFKCKQTGHRARFCTQNKPQVRSRPQINKRPSQNKPVHNIEQKPRSPVECWNCGKVGHVRADCWGSHMYQRAQQNRGRPSNRQGRTYKSSDQVNRGSSQNFKSRSYFDKQKQEN